MRDSFFCYNSVMKHIDFLSLPHVKSCIAEIERDLLQKTFDQNVYPPKENRFLALSLTPIHKVKVVILGQDPYHQPNQAHGLAFSSLTKPIPKSLKNIFKAISLKYHDVDDENGDLTRWAHQGVLLWNVYLSVVEGKPLSHRLESYETLTKMLLETISQTQSHVVFMLWGSFAQSFKPYIKGHHLILTASHPSPLSVYRGFYEADHFYLANQYLHQHHQHIIDWR